MTKFTKALRQQIVRDFAIRHNGHFNPNFFVEEVRRTGAEHPAYDWFEWNKDKAAKLYQVEQAREFARDLRVTFTVEVVGRNRPVVIREREMPLVLSPMDQRSRGGGYVLVDPEDPAHMAEHCRQAAAALDAWLDRYRSALEHAGGSVPAVEDMAKALHSVGPKDSDKAA